MTLQLIYWVLMLIWLVFGIFSAWPFSEASLKSNVGSLFTFLLFLILGWAQFGAPVKG